MTKKGIYITILAILLGIGGCNRSYNKVLKSTDMDAKLAKAKEYYNEGDCFKAIPLFEELISFYKGTRDVEEIYYSYAYCHYTMGEYIVATYHFDRFMNLYPRSKKLEDAAFMTAKCNHEQSPKYSLDQTPTLDAIEQYRLFTKRFPNSDRVLEANDAIDELRLKLHRKAFDNAKLYFKLKEYQAASASFKNLIGDFPESSDVEESYYYIVLANKLFADNSYDAKKEERYQQTVLEYDIFKQKYPQSGYLEELEKVHNLTLKELTNFNQ